MTSTFRTAGCGPARPVVWEGSLSTFRAVPYPDQRTVGRKQMNRRLGNRRIENGLGVVLMTMAVSTIGFILAGSTDPQTHRVPPWVGNYFTTELPYPWSAVSVSCLLVLTEAFLLWFLLARTNMSAILRTLASCAVAGISAVAIRSAGLDRSRGYAKYHVLWLTCATTLMATLFVVVVVHSTLRRVISRVLNKPMKLS